MTPGGTYVKRATSEPAFNLLGRWGVFVFVLQPVQKPGVCSDTHGIVYSEEHLTLKYLYTVRDRL